jgi:histidine kinase
MDPTNPLQQLRLRGIEVLWELEPDIPRILADPGRLEQVFINLLLNARDAIEEKWEGQDAAPGSVAIDRYSDDIATHSSVSAITAGLHAIGSRTTAKPSRVPIRNV